MHTDIVAAERLDVHRLPIHAPLHHVLPELEKARQLVNRLAHDAYDQLDGEGMHDLASIEGLISGAMTKLQAAGARS